MDLSFFVIPVEGDADVFRSFPIFCYPVVFFERVDSVVGVLFADVLDSKVVD